MTPTMKEALKALVEHSGEGAIQKNGTILAAGEVLGTAPEISFSSMTWLRLVSLGFIEGAGKNRIRATASGREAVK